MAPKEFIRMINDLMKEFEMKILEKEKLCFERFFKCDVSPLVSIQRESPKELSYGQITSIKFSNAVCLL